MTGRLRSYIASIGTDKSQLEPSKCCLVLLIPDKWLALGCQCCQRPSNLVNLVDEPLVVAGEPKEAVNFTPCGNCKHFMAWTFSRSGGGKSLMTCMAVTTSPSWPVVGGGSVANACHNHVSSS